MTCGHLAVCCTRCSTGKRAFDGEDVSDTLAAVLRGEPDWAALPAEVPAAIRTLLQRCLAKDRRQRIADIAVALFVLDDPASVAPASAAPISSATIAPRPPLWRRMAIPSGTWLIGVAMAGIAVWFATRATIPPPRVSRFLITPPSAAALTLSAVLQTWPSRLMARASSTSAPTARRSSCARSISSTPRRSPGSARRLDRSSRRTASGSASSMKHSR